MSAKRSFLPLWVTNLFGVTNDNYIKALASFVMLNWVEDPQLRSTLMGITAAMLVMPYVLCSPLADRLTAAFSKLKVVRLAKIAELPLVAMAIASLHFHSIAGVIFSIVAIGLQSSLYSPAKYALIRDIGGKDRVSVGMGGMEGVSFLGVLGGTVFAAIVADHAPPAVWYASMIALAVLGLVGSFTIRVDEEPNRLLHSINPWRYFMRVRRMTKRYPSLDSVIFALCIFWGAAAMIQQGLLVYGRQVMGLDSTHTGVLLALAAIGIVAGQVIAGVVDRRFPLLELVPFFGLVATALLCVIFFVPMGALPFGIVLAILAALLGFFKLPLDAEIQRTVKGPRLNTVLSYFNQITFLYMFVSSIVYIAISWMFGAGAFFVVLILAMAYVSFSFCFGCRRALSATGNWCLSRRYKIAATPMPTGKTLLVLPNHPALIDPLLVLATYRTSELRPLVDAAFFNVGVFAKILRTVGAVKVPDLRLRHTAKDVAAVKGLHENVLETLRNGGNVILYPSGHIYTENRENIGTRQLAYNLCRDLPEGVEVVCLRTVGLWGSIWSRKGKKKTPSFALTLIRGLFLWLFVSPFRPRRKVTMHAEVMTDQLKKWAEGTRMEFNGFLTAWYNQEAVEHTA